MNMKLELYYFDACPFCQLVLRKIDELGLKDSIVYKDIFADPANRDFHIKQTGRATTPCLYINDKPMFESADINQWLTENAQKIKN